MKWQMHIAGPDDLQVFDSELEALREANRVNLHYQKMRQKMGGGDLPAWMATVGPLPEQRLITHGDDCEGIYMVDGVCQSCGAK